MLAGIIMKQVPKMRFARQMIDAIKFARRERGDAKTEQLI
jgi:hypothetical protein